MNRTVPTGLRPRDCDGFGNSNIKKCKSVVNDIAGSQSQPSDLMSQSEAELDPRVLNSCYSVQSNESTTRSAVMRSIKTAAFGVGIDPKILLGLLIQESSDCKGGARTPLTDSALASGGNLGSFSAFNIDPKLFAFALQSRGKDADLAELKMTITNSLVAAAVSAFIIKDLLQVISEVEAERPDFAGPEISVADVPRIRRDHPDRFLIAKSALVGAGWYGGFRNARNRIRQICDGAESDISNFAIDKNSCYYNSYTGATQAASNQLEPAAGLTAFQC